MELLNPPKTWKRAAGSHWPTFSMNMTLLLRGSLAVAVCAVASRVGPTVSATATTVGIKAAVQTLRASQTHGVWWERPLDWQRDAEPRSLAMSMEYPRAGFA
jgi:hypothetical protein